MVYRKSTFVIDGYDNDIMVEISLTDKVKIPEEVLNKALMITMNYLIENMKPAEQEEPE